MRNKTFHLPYYIYSLILAIFTLVSCESDLPEGEWSKTPPVYHFSVDKQMIETNSKSLSDHLSIKTNADWTANADASWISLSPSSGKGDAQVSVSITENTTTSDRTGIITVRSLALDSIARISVSQLGKSLNVGQNSLTYSNESETKTVSISAEGNVSVSTSEPWITAKIIGSELSVSVESNISSTDRTGSVLVEIYGLSSGSLSHEISVLQAGKDYNFSITNKDVTTTSAAFSDLIVLSTNDEWILSVDQDWITLSATSGQGDANINLNVAENKTTEKRAAIVSISGKYSGKNASVTITQDGKYLTVDPMSLSFSSSSDSKTISITTNGVTTVTTEGDWFIVSQEGNTLTVKTEKNIATTSRKGSITVALTELTSGSLSRTIEVIQTGMSYTLSVNETSISVGSSSASETFSITSNDSWTVSSDATWAILSAASGNGDKTITVSVSANSSTSARSAKITVKGTNSGISKTITLSQEGKQTTGENGVNNGHEYVDLELPSGLLWATCNIGATDPEEYGDYYAWGETITKTTYDWSTNQFYNRDNGSWMKYNNVDNKIVLEAEDDAARINWGGKWRIPTHNELTELRNNCSWEWTTQNGINGYRVTSKKNNNIIFLPAAGYQFASQLEDAGVKGEYWSSSRSEWSTSNAYFLSIGGGIGYGTGGRSTGKPIRPVCEY